MVYKRYTIYDQKNDEYKEYIKNHVDNVKKALDEIINKLSHEIIECLNTDTLIRNVLEHDQSKYSVEEFEAYRKKFYPIDDDEKNNFDEEEFEIAWKHHYENNPHHPEFWKKEPMPIEYVIEMVCDWEAMSYVFGGSAVEHYEKNKEHIRNKLHPDTVVLLEKVLDNLR